MKRAGPLLALALGGCLHVGLPMPKLGAGSAPAPAAASARAVCPGALMADVPAFPALPAGAGFPAPQDAASSAAVSLYLTWLHALAVYARQGWERAGEAKDYCSTAH